MLALWVWHTRGMSSRQRGHNQYSTNNPPTAAPAQPSLITQAVTSPRRSSGSSSDMAARRVLAQRPDTPPRVLKRLADEPDHFVQWRVAINHHTPGTALDRLASSPNNQIRWIVTRNPNVLPSTLERLADDSYDDVRLAVAQCADCPPAVLERLLDDQNFDVAQAAAEHWSLPDAALTQWLAHSEFHPAPRHQPDQTGDPLGSYPGF